MSEQQNPFLAQPPAGGGFTPSGRAVDAGRGIEWFKQGWQSFTKNPGIWIALALILMVIIVVLGFIPFLGNLALALLSPVFAGGLLAGCKALSEGGELRVDHLFAGFKEKTGNLIVVGAVSLGAFVLIALIMLAIGGGSAMTGAMMGRGMGAGMAVGGFLVGMLVGLALSVPLAMAVWFAPALVMFRDVAPVEAMKRSFSACLKNIAPFLIYGIILFVLSLVAMIPFGLGFLVLIPVTVGSVYSSYVEIFE
ncbi:MAG: BPSS1780 family membrane protein [Pseudomonadota bacterium]|jgi:uncharacterized membrane protein